MLFVIRHHGVDSLLDRAAHLDVRTLISANFTSFSGIKMILPSFAFNRFAALCDLETLRERFMRFELSCHNVF